MSQTVQSLSYFGKTPQAADFVVHHQDRESGVAFQNWLIDGMSIARERLGDRWEALYEALPSLRFVYWKGTPDELLVGSLISSKDESGRRFPLTGFWEISYEHVESCRWDLPVRYDGLFREVTSRLRPHREADHNLSLKTEVETWPAPDSLSNPENNSIGNLKVGDIDAAFGQPWVERASINLLELSFRVRRWAGWVPDFGLRFPLPPEGPLYLPTLHFWLQLTRITMGEGNGVPNLLWTEARSVPGFIDVYYATPSPVAALFLVAPDLEGDSVYPVHEEDSPRVHLDTNEGRAVIGQVQDKDTSLEEVLRLVSTHSPRSSA